MCYVETEKKSLPDNVGRIVMEEKNLLFRE